MRSARQRAKQRAKARELLMQMLFQMEIQQDFSDNSRDAFLGKHLKDESQLAYINAVHTVVRKELGRIDYKIEISSENWKSSRMAKVDLTILRLAAAEIFYMEDIPDSVAANEAVELAKAFGGDDSRKFVNGVIGRLIRGKHGLAPPETYV